MAQIPITDKLDKRRDGPQFLTVGLRIGTIWVYRASTLGTTEVFTVRVDDDQRAAELVG
jgi:hypothetical protein